MERARCGCVVTSTRMPGVGAPAPLCVDLGKSLGPAQHIQTGLDGAVLMR